MSFKNLPYLFISIALVFFGLSFFIENNNGSFLLNDFKVYYSASQVVLDGGQPYGVAYGLGSGFFKYSPVTLFLFSPYTLFTFETAKVLHFVIISFLSIGAFQLCFQFAQRNIESKITKQTGFLLLLLIMSAVHLARELHLGNINMIMLFFFLLAIYLLNKDKTIWSALVFAILILLKPYFLILILPVIIAKKGKLIGWTFAFLPILIFLPSLVVGFDQNNVLLENWGATMTMHNAGMISEHTFTSIFYSYSGITLNTNWQYLFIILVGIIYGVLRFKFFFGKEIYTERKMLSDFFILLALIPNMVITDSQHFLFSLPLIALILAHLKQELKWYLIATFVILFFFYGANSNDLLGNPLSNKFDEFSTIGVANLGLIFLLVYLNRSKELKKVPSSFS
jgi:Glycosyltransferase family 87